MSPGRRNDSFAGDSHVGLVRSGNEDAFLVAPPLFAVADGLGGHHAGEVASSTAIDTLLEAAPRAADAKSLGRAVRRANTAVIQAAESGLGRSGMGTTLTAAMVDGTRIAVAHVGDSRAYLLHFGELQQLTQDHSMVADLVRQGQLTAEESRHHPNRSVITRALGSDPNMLVDTFEIEAADGDRLLLATDGLTSMVDDDRIEQALGSEPTPQAAVDALVDSALTAGGHDNITVVVVDIGKASAGNGQRIAAVKQPGANRSALWLLWVLAAIAIVAGAVWSANSYARTQAYLISENGMVMIYEGVPGDFAGISMSWLSEETTLSASSLDVVTANRLAAGIRVDGLEQAHALLEEYRARTTGEPPSAPAP
ncbi:MAG: Stp1/IreP family PP2C-type Ser/Thr phosphatase [Coriobacteriia bacterium]|nr:Stp1/IreP family PP2C-type Ser/Thr phosphatase [Coriobacteriia bacterium]